MTTRIIIQHQSGSKVNQIEQFALEGCNELTFGRDPKAAVVFDPERDDLVSRNHAVIKVQQGEPPTFTIRDLDSANGTRVNGNPMKGEQELQVGDFVELGAPGGASFVFDLQPRPPNLMSRTRVVGVMPANATRVPASTSVAAASPTTMTAKPAVGRETVERMIYTQRRATEDALEAQQQRTTRVWQYLAMAVVLVIGISGGAMYYLHHRVAANVAAAREEMRSAITSANAGVNAALTQRLGLSSQDLAQKYANATVNIQFQWRAYDRSTGKPLFHRALTVNGQKLPCFVELANRTIVPWLTTEDEDQSNFIVGWSGKATGFVIDDQGYILTNKHVAAMWMRPIDEDHLTHLSGEGELYQMQDDTTKVQTPRRITLGAGGDWDRSGNHSWVPANGGVIFRSKQPIPVSGPMNNIEGKDEILEVRFPGQRAGISARLVRAAPDADVALIKIDTQQKLTWLELAEDDSVKVGEKVTVVGYPEYTNPTYVVFNKTEVGASSQGVEQVPDPTVTEGIISHVGRGGDGKANGEHKASDVKTVSDEGDLYQLSVPTGAGNSGAPIFDSSGKVIGIFTYYLKGHDNVNYASPISYGRALRMVQ
jgi:S1-C subfamily serine protease